MTKKQRIFIAFNSLIAVYLIYRKGRMIDEFDFIATDNYLDLYNSIFWILLFVAILLVVLQFYVKNRMSQFITLSIGAIIGVFAFTIQPDFDPYLFETAGIYSNIGTDVDPEMIDALSNEEDNHYLIYFGEESAETSRAFKPFLGRLSIESGINPWYIDLEQFEDTEEFDAWLSMYEVSREELPALRLVGNQEVHTIDDLSEESILHTADKYELPRFDFFGTELSSH